MDVREKTVTGMAEYIEREAAQTSCRKYSFAESYDAFAVDCILKAIPAADVAPVRHGRWERTAEGAALCTACKRKMNPSQYGYAFCSLCGAKMDGGAD